MNGVQEQFEPAGSDKTNQNLWYMYCFHVPHGQPTEDWRLQTVHVSFRISI